MCAGVRSNAAVFKDIVRLYVPTGSVVVDLNFGRGWFWTDIDQTKYTVVAIDIDRERLTGMKPGHNGVCADQQTAPIRRKSVAAVVIDPPYGCWSTTVRTDSIGRAYNLHALCGDVAKVYETAMCEAADMLDDKGICIVKCQDAINSGKQHFVHIQIHQIALDLKWIAEDFFVVVQAKTPMMRHKHQLHARKNHSYFWVFRKRT